MGNGKSGEHTLEVETLRRLDDHSGRIVQVEKALADGRVSFENIRGDIRLLTMAVEQLTLKVAQSMESRPGPWQKLGDAFIFWAAPILGGAALWLIRASGQIPQGVAS